MTTPEALVVIERVIPEMILLALAEKLLASEGRRLSRPVQLNLDFREGIVVNADVLPREPLFTRVPDRRRGA